MTVVATVKFEGSERVYDYEVPSHLEADAVKGAHAVVESPHNGYQVVEVLDIKDRLDSEWEGKFNVLVDLVDDSQFVRARLDDRRAERIKRELDDRVADIQTLESYERLAGMDPKIRDLLDELKELKGLG